MSLVGGEIGVAEQLHLGVRLEHRGENRVARISEHPSRPNQLTSNAAVGFKLGVNYGWNKIRFPAPVPTGSRIRSRAEINSVEEVADGWWQVIQTFTVEIEGGEKPVCVGEHVGRVLPE